MPVFRLLMLCSLLSLPAGGLAQDPVLQTSASVPEPLRQEVILRPKPNRNVTEEEDILGQVEPGQIPVVLVRQNLPNARWVVQSPARMEDHHFRATVRFGNEQTPLPAAYQLRVLLISDPQIAAAFRPGMELPLLPEEIPASQDVQVIRRGPVLRYSILEKPGVEVR